MRSSGGLGKQFAGGAGYDLLMFASERPGNGYDALTQAAVTTTSTARSSWARADHPEVRRGRASWDVATVGVALEVEGPPTTSVESDNEAGSAAAVRHLYELGHCIAHITGLLDKRRAPSACAAATSLQRLGSTPRDVYVDSGSDAMRKRPSRSTSRRPRS